MPADATASATRASASPGGASRDASVQRILKIAIVVMGVLIVAGLLTVIARMVYLAGQRGQSSAAVSGVVAPSARLPLPDGAAVRSIAVSGDRLAVHYDAPTGAGIAILDLATGAPLSRVELVPEPPRR